MDSVEAMEEFKEPDENTLVYVSPYERQFSQGYGGTIDKVLTGIYEKFNGTYFINWCCWFWSRSKYK